MENKRGLTSITLLGIIFVGLVLMIVLGMMILAFGIVDISFSEIDYNIGGTSFNQTYNDTLYQGISAMKTTVPRTISTGVLLGMILCMIMIGYFTTNINRLWIILDIFVLIIAEIAAVLTRSSFLSFVNSNPIYIEIFSTTLSTSSKYILSMPTLIPTVGVIIMIVTYAIKPKKRGDFT